jgi:hypothetical protein
MPEISNILGKPYQYRRCFTVDIDGHFDKIKHWVPEDEHAEFLDRMTFCVTTGNAWCTENTFLYYTKESPGVAHGVALFGQEHAQELIALFMGIFSRHDPKPHALRFKLHPGKTMEEYKAILTSVSMKRAAQNPERTVLVRIDELKNKLFSAFKAQGLAK